MHSPSVAAGWAPLKPMFLVNECFRVCGCSSSAHNSSKFNITMNFIKLEMDIRFLLNLTHPNTSTNTRSATMNFLTSVNLSLFGDLTPWAQQRPKFVHRGDNRIRFLVKQLSETLKIP